MSGMDADLGKAWRDGCWETAAAHFDEGARELERHGKVPAGMLTELSPSAREGMLETMVAHAEHEALLERYFGTTDRTEYDIVIRLAIEMALPEKALAAIRDNEDVSIDDVAEAVVDFLQSREGTERELNWQDKQVALRKAGEE